jgi:hypothetical protein
LRLSDYHDLIQNYTKLIKKVIETEMNESNCSKSPIARRLNENNYLNRYRLEKVVEYEFFSLSYREENCSIRDFLLHLNDDFKHENIGFSDLPIRYVMMDSELLIFFIWFDDSLKNTIRNFYESWNKEFDKNLLSLKCLPEFYLK